MSRLSGSQLQHKRLKFWSRLYVDQGVKVKKRLSICYESSSRAATASTRQHGHIATQGTITCQWHSAAPKIYTKTEVDNAVTTSLRIGQFKVYYHDWGTLQRGIISHAFQVVFALSSTTPPATTSYIMTMHGFTGRSLVQSTTITAYLYSINNQLP